MELCGGGMSSKAVEEPHLAGERRLLPPGPFLWDIFEMVWLSGLSYPDCGKASRPLPDVGRPRPSQPTLTCAFPSTLVLCQLRSLDKASCAQNPFPGPDGLR